jgi:hypothetical protein
LTEIYGLTYKEAEKYYDFFCRKEDEKNRMNFHLLLTAGRGKKEDVKRTYRMFENEEQENDIEDQFQGVNFG